MAWRREASTTRAAISTMASQLLPSRAGKRITARSLMPPLIKRPRARASAISRMNAVAWRLVPGRRREAEEFFVHRRNDENLRLFRKSCARQDNMRILAALDREAVSHAIQEILQLPRAEIVDRDDQ